MGLVRASIAYEFYIAVRDYCILKASSKAKWKKPTFEATNYQLYYCASDDEDARGKLDCHMVLHRSTDMWSCSKLEGCKGAHEFVGVPEIDDVSHNSKINMRFLPCPCGAWLQGDVGNCTNTNAHCGDYDTNHFEV